MSVSPLKALFFAPVPLPESGGRILYVNGQVCEELAGYVQNHDLTVQQYFKPYAAGFETVSPRFPQNDEEFDLIMIAGSKQKDEVRFAMATALKLLSRDGYMVCAAANDAGGRRLKKDMESLGLVCGELSKYKSRVVWGAREGPFNQTCIDEWMKTGALQDVLGGLFQSQPGVFGWNKIDKGSALLGEHLPHDLSGKGADFGCGYGYLSDYILSRNENVDALYCIDADHRALDACELNLKKYRKDASIQYLWHDLTMPLSFQALDWVIMNPPFHAGKEVSSSIGAGFIRAASSCLRDRGCLWMVANAHLPYETVLDKHFSRYKNLFEGNGFKVFCATK